MKTDPKKTCPIFSAIKKQKYQRWGEFAFCKDVFIGRGIKKCQGDTVFCKMVVMMVEGKKKHDEENRYMT